MLPKIILNSTKFIFKNNKNSLNYSSLIDFIKINHWKVKKKKNYSPTLKHKSLKLLYIELLINIYNSIWITYKFK